MTDQQKGRAAVQAVARFGQLSASQIQEICFADFSSRTTLDRALKDLLQTNHLSRIERRLVGGSKGGSGQYVYQLGSRGHQIYGNGTRYVPARAINHHSLAIADTFLVFRALERAGRFRIVGYSVDREGWVEIGPYTTTQDLTIELDGGERAQRRKYWLEVDLGSEGQKQLKAKFTTYWRAYNAADGSEWWWNAIPDGSQKPVFPLIVFVAIDAERAAELRWLLEQGPAEARQLFRVTTLDDLSTQPL